MKHVKRIPLILMLSFLSFFSCKPTDLVKPEKLNAIELKAVIETLPTYHAFVQAQSEANQVLVRNIQTLGKQDKKWLTYIHQKYPTPARFVSNAKSLELDTYTKLTGLDLVDGNSKVNVHFNEFISALQVKARYNAQDLAAVLYPETEQKLTQKFFPSCATYCTYEAGRQQRRVYRLCLQSSPDDPAQETLCAQKAQIAFSYYLAKCIKSCSGF